MEADWSIPLDEHAMDCAWHPNRRLAAAGLVDGGLRLFDCSGAQPAARLSQRPHADSCRAVAFASGGASLASGAADRCLLVTDLEGGAELHRVRECHEAAVTRVLATDAHCLASGDEGGAVRLWDLRLKPGPPTHSLAHHADAVSDLALHPSDASGLLAASADGSVSAIDLRKHALAQQTEGDPDDEATAVAFLKGGRKAVVASMTGTLTVHDWGKLDRPGSAFPGHPAAVDSLAALDADTVATGGGDGVIRVISVLPNRLLGVLGQDETGGCERLAASHDGGLLAAVSYAPVLRLWDLQGGSDSQEEEGEEAAAGGSDSDGSGSKAPPAKKARGAGGKAATAKSRATGAGRKAGKPGFFDDLL